MRSEILIFTPVLVFLSSLCVNGILYNGTGVRKSKPMNVPTLRIKIIDKATSLPKVSAKIIGNGNPIPKIMARIYHGPKSKQMFRRRFHTQPTIKHQPYYYRRTKFPPVRNISPQMQQHHHLAKPPINTQGINQPYFRGPSLYPTQLHYTSPNELESNHLSDNSIIRPTSPKGYLPVNNFQTDYLKLFEDINNSNENDFLGGRHQSNFPKLSQYGNSVRLNPIIPAVPTINQESQSIQLEFHEPHNIAPDKIHPNLSEEAKRYIEFMASGDYFLPKVHPDYRKILPSTQNYYVSQTKYLEQQQRPPQSQELYIPLSQRKPPSFSSSSLSSPSSSSSSSSSELSRNRSPEKIEFTEKDAIHSHPQYNRSPVKDPEIDIRGRFVGNPIFAGRKKEYDDTRGSESSLSEGVVKEPLQDFKRIPGNDGRVVTGEENVHNEIIKVPGYTEMEFCDKKCSDSDNDSRDNIDLLCGTDRITYYNEAQLLCIVSCTNADIDIDYRGPCIQSRE